MTPSEPGGYVGDIFFGNPGNPTQGTHRWDGSEWVKLPSEQVAMLGLLVEARTRAEKLEAALTDAVSTFDAYLAFTSDDPRHVALRMVVHGSKRTATAALEAK